MAMLMRDLDQRFRVSTSAVSLSCVIIKSSPIWNQGNHIIQARGDVNVEVMITLLPDNQTKPALTEYCEKKKWCNTTANRPVQVFWQTLTFFSQLFFFCFVLIVVHSFTLKWPIIISVQECSSLWQENEMKQMDYLNKDRKSINTNRVAHLVENTFCLIHSKQTQ